LTKQNSLQHLALVQITILSIAVLLTGCATVHDTYAPDGRKAYALNCSGLARGWDKCLSAAGDICGAQGYDILDRSDEPMAVGSAASSNGTSGAGYAQTNERSMLVACKK
jgi:hypothetical protein